jgi:predicted RNA-binding protein YlqC (UPF0109 family)
MDISFLKFLLLPIIDNKDALGFEFKLADEVFNAEVRIIVATEDMKKIIGHKGKLYRAIKVIIKYALKQDLVNVIVDIRDKK